MNSKIIELLQENNKLLKEISRKLDTSSPESTFSDVTPTVSVSRNNRMVVTKLDNERNNFRSGIQFATVVNAEENDHNGLIFSNINGIDIIENVRTEVLSKKSSVIKRIELHGNKMLITFTSGKKYQYTSDDEYIMRPLFDKFRNAYSLGSVFHRHLRSNENISYREVR